MQFRPIIFLVEGNETEEVLTRQAITNSGMDCDVRVARDGVEACTILFESHEPPPTLILLDLNISKLSGFDVLTRIRAEEKTKRLPVIVFSATAEPSVIYKSFDLHANSFVQKDEDLECFETRLKLLLYYWIAVNKNVNT
jgi:two-component system response regulator